MIKGHEWKKSIMELYKNTIQ